MTSPVSAQPSILGSARGNSPAKGTACARRGVGDSAAPAVDAHEAIGVLSMPDQALALLKNRLKQTPHLVVIDNLETVADMEALLLMLHVLSTPSKFLTISMRKRLVGERNIYLYPVPELSLDHACGLVRQAAAASNAVDLAAATDGENFNRSTPLSAAIRWRCC